MAWSKETNIKGNKGDQGDPGLPNVLTVGTVTTVLPTEPAAVEITGTSPAQVINFEIPQGVPGPGSAGINKGTGAEVFAGADPGTGIMEFWRVRGAGVTTAVVDALGVLINTLVSWTDIAGKPSTFPPTLPIPSSGVTGLDAAQTAQDTAIAGKVNDTGDTMTGPLVLPAGAVGAPALAIAAANNGIYGSAGNINFSLSGAAKLLMSTTAITPTVPLRAFDGTAAAPAYSFNSGNNSGMWRVGTDQIGFSTGGTNRLTLSTAALTSTLPVVLPADPTANLQAATKQYVDTNDALKVAKAGDTMTGDLIISHPGYSTVTVTSSDSYAATVYSYGAAGGAVVDVSNGANHRWQEYFDDTAYYLKRYDNAGTGYNSLTLDRLTGKVTVEGDPTAALGVATKQYVDANAGGGTAASILAKLITVDGAGSGLDADLLDGQSGAYYLNNANSTGTLPAASLPGSAFTTDSTQTMLQTARKTILTDTAINQAGGSNFMMQSSASSGDAIMTFHSPGAFATNFGMKSNGNFYKGGWSNSTAQYRFWDEQNIPLGAVADIQNSVGSYKLFTGAAIEQRNNEWVNYAISRIVPTVAAQPAGGVGTYAYLRFNGSSGTFSPGGQYAGSTLIWSGGNNSNGAVSGGGSPGGSWMAMGSSTVSSGTFATLFLRYA